MQKVFSKDQILMWEDINVIMNTEVETLPPVMGC